MRSCQTTDLCRPQSKTTPSRWTKTRLKRLLITKSSPKWRPRTASATRKGTAILETWRHLNTSWLSAVIREDSARARGIWLTLSCNIIWEVFQTSSTRLASNSTQRKPSKELATIFCRRAFRKRDKLRSRSKSSLSFALMEIRETWVNASAKAASSTLAWSTDLITTNWSKTLKPCATSWRWPKLPLSQRLPARSANSAIIHFSMEKPPSASANSLLNMRRIDAQKRTKSASAKRAVRCFSWSRQPTEPRLTPRQTQTCSRSPTPSFSPSPSKSQRERVK